MKDGIVYVTEDRKAEGFFETMSIAENLYSGLLAAGLERLPYVSMREMRDAVAALEQVAQRRAPSTTMRG